MGSSIVKHAFLHARQLNEGSSLGLNRFNATILWQGRGGLICSRLLPTIRHLLTIEDHPHLLVIHCGGNDIGQVNSCVLGHRMAVIIRQLIRLLLHTKIIFSQILPRLHWRGELNHTALNRVRIRINSKIASLVIRNVGYYFKYPELSELNPDLFSRDKVHLSETGNDIFLLRLQQYLTSILTSSSQKM